MVNKNLALKVTSTPMAAILVFARPLESMHALVCFAIHQPQKLRNEALGAIRVNSTMTVAIAASAKEKSMLALWKLVLTVHSSQTLLNCQNRPKQLSANEAMDVTRENHTLTDATPVFVQMELMPVLKWPVSKAQHLQTHHQSHKSPFKSAAMDATRASLIMMGVTLVSALGQPMHAQRGLAYLQLQTRPLLKKQPLYIQTALKDIRTSTIATLVFAKAETMLVPEKLATTALSSQTRTQWLKQLTRFINVAMDVTMENPIMMDATPALVWTEFMPALRKLVSHCPSFQTLRLLKKQPHLIQVATKDIHTKTIATLVFVRAENTRAH